MILSGLFSGLTLGLLSLDIHSLARRAKHGDRDAQTILPVRENGNLLLTTLLLGNVAVNTTLSIFLGSIASGIVAGITATALIVVFGEIIPQAVISRHAIWFGSRTIWFTRLTVFLLYPISWPISKILDKFLGDELPTTYSKSELMDIISEHEESEHSDLDADEERILHGALNFSHRSVREVMTTVDKVVSVDENQKLNDDFYEMVTESGFSRIPVFSGKATNIIGVLYVKELLTEVEDIAVRDTEEALDKKMLTVRGNHMLDTVLARMLKTRHHLAIVRNSKGEFIGVISLEDIIEEIIQQEIVDEDDEVDD